MYSIVYIQDGLELIPTNWLTEDDKSYYPPYCSRSRIEKAIKQMENPEACWKKYTIKRFLGMAATYERGIQKLKAVTKVSEIETDCENIGKIKRWTYENAEEDSITKKQRRTYKEEADSNSKDECSSTLTMPPELTIPSQGYESQNISATPPSCSSLYSQREEGSSDDDFKNFLKKSIREIFVKLNRLEERLETLQEAVIDLNKNSASEAQFLTDDVNIFPLVSVEHLEDLEEKLADVTFFKKMVNTLKGVGGNDNYSAVAGVLKKVLSNEVAEQYSLAGARKKRCFKDLILYKVLLEAVRNHRHNITEYEFSELIARWLVQAKLRKERAKEQQMRKNTSL